MSAGDGGGEAAVSFRDGRLGDAVAAANAAVRTRPSDPGARVLLAELLVFAGNLERADVILDACGDLDPTLAVVVAEFRQLVRGEMARRQLFRDGRVPEFLGEPDAAQRASLAAMVALRSGEYAQAGQQAEAAEQARARPGGHDRAGVWFDDLRDGDDLLAPTLEAITTTGKYYWIAMSRIVSLEFHPPKRPRDLYWRRCSVTVASGPDGDVYVPAIYAFEGIEPALLTDAVRLGRATDWVATGEGGPTRGIGAVTWLVGEDARTLMELDALSFETPPAAP